jgi:hypothetical protein
MAKVATLKKPQYKSFAEMRPDLVKTKTPSARVAVVSADRANDLVTTTIDGAAQWFEAQLRRACEEGVFVIEEILTAAMARYLLDLNPDNRRVSEYQVDQLAEEMRTGIFDGMNGQTVQISICGQLNDGQHRLHAKLKSGVDFSTRFMFGLPRDARLTIDQGRSRTSGDYLMMSGHGGGQRAASVAALLWQWRSYSNISRNSSTRIGKSHASSYAREHYEQIKASMQAVPLRGCPQVGGAILLTFAHLVFAEKDFGAASMFIERLINGNELDEKSPILVLRQRLTHPASKRLTRVERFELIIRAWNAWREQRTITNLPLHKRNPEIAK